MSADVPPIPEAGDAPAAGTVRPAAPAWQAQAVTDDDDLRQSLAALSQLATAQMKFADVLTRVSEFAVLAIPNADGVGLMLVEARHAENVVASAPFVAEVEAVQLRIDEGPCITAITEARVVRSGSLDTDPQWPHFGPEVGDLGVRSALAVPLRNDGDVLGALNVYSHQSDAFDERAVGLGELFAVPAAIAVHNAQVLSHAKLVAARLETALTQRAVIDQAMGILIGRVGCTAEEASNALRRMSEGREDLHGTALRLVDEAIHRVRPENDAGARPRSAPATAGPRATRGHRFWGSFGKRD
jgi:putative methionine-R-sulfoxide reductase with GAF domain